MTYGSFLPFVALFHNTFWPRDPTITWEKGNLGALGSAVASLLLGEQKKVNAPFWIPRARKMAETARFGPSIPVATFRIDS